MKGYIRESEIIKVLKYKLAVKKQHIYVCCVMFINLKTDTVLKISCIVSFSPLIYEIDICDEYTKVENLINKYKLESESCFDFTKKVYLKLYENENLVIEAVNKEKIHIIDEIFANILNVNKELIKSSFEIEKLKSLETTEQGAKLEKIINPGIDKFFIKTKPVIDDKKGISVSKLKLKKEILCELTDKREIVKYIMQILFSKEVKFLYGKVSEIIPRNNERLYEITCNITPVIFTKFIVDSKQKLVVNK